MGRVEWRQLSLISGELFQAMAQIIGTVVGGPAIVGWSLGASKKGTPRCAPLRTKTSGRVRVAPVLGGDFGLRVSPPGTPGTLSYSSAFPLLYSNFTHSHTYSLLKWP